MRCKTHLLIVIVVMFAFVSWGQAEEYQIKLRSHAEETVAIALSIDGDMAVSKVADVTERFDVKNQRWLHDESKQWVSLSQCETWAKQSREKSSKSTAAVPEQIRPFVQWSLDPQFEIALTENTLTLIAGQVDYKISVEKSDHDLSNYYRYATLSAYKKAMTERTLPPFAELKVLDALERRMLMPRSMEVKISGVPGAPSFTMDISARAK